MAVVTVDADVTVTAALASPTRTQVVISTLVIYQFYLDSGTNDFSWRKTTDGGATWSTAVSVFGAGSGGQWFDIYYERWNGSDKQNVVHLAYAQDFGTRGIYYRTMDLNSDSFTPSVLALALSPLPGAVAHGLGVSRNGTIRIDGRQTGSSPNAVYSTDGVTWNSAGASFAEANTDKFVTWADFSGDVDDFICVYWDISALEYSVKQWDKSAGTITETAIETAITTAWGTALNRGSGHIYMVNYDAGTDIHSWDIYGSSITARADVITGSSFLNGLTLAINVGGKVRCYFGQDDSLASNSSLEVYYKESTDGMLTWGSRTAYGSNSTQLNRIVSDPGPLGGVAPAWQTATVLYIESPVGEWPGAPVTGTIPPTDSNGGGTGFIPAPSTGYGTTDSNPSDSSPSDQTLDSNPSDAELIDSNPSDDAGLFV